MFQLVKSFRSAILVVAGAAALAVTTSARAQAVFSIAGSPSASAGTTGNYFDVLMTNNYGFNLLVSSFTFKVQAGSPIGDSDIVLTSVTTGTSMPYLYGGSSAGGPTLASGGTLSSITAGDTFVGPLPPVAAGATVGLGRVFFSVAPGASTKSVPLVFVGTNRWVNFEDSFDAIVQNSSLNITAAKPGVPVVPLPASVWSGATLLVGMAAWGIRRRRQVAG